MRHILQISACAPIAIAMAALPATSAAAQDAAAPVIVLPDVNSAPVPAPTVMTAATPAPAVAPRDVAPPEALESTVSTPEPEPAPVRATRTSSTRENVRTSNPTRENGRTPDVAPIQNTGETVPIGVAEMNGAEVSPVNPVEESTASVGAVPFSSSVITDEANPPVSDDSTNALWFGLLAALGIGGATFAIARSRRRRHDEPAIIERPIVATAQTAVTASEVAAPVFENPRPAAAYPATQALPVAGAALALPQEIPQSYEERDRLMRQMIAAKPDRANPFQSPKARARRARLIMQSLGQDFRNRKPRFDLSQYAHIWPALRGWQPATA